MTTATMIDSAMQANDPTQEEFAAMLEESFSSLSHCEGSVVVGKIIAIENNEAVIDIGMKTEGRVGLHEFETPSDQKNLAPGQEVRVFLDRIENAQGEAVLSRERARREEAWDKLKKSYDANERVEGVIFNQVKGGFTVDLAGAIAFLPGSQVDIRPVRNVNALLNIPQPFQILKMDRQRNNIVVSRRTVLEETQAVERASLIQRIVEGEIFDGIVKNVTDYGAFVDLGGVDGMVHITDMAWRRLNHPSEILQIGQTIKVKVIRVNQDTQRVSLGIKQLEPDPWDGIENKYPTQSKFPGRVTNITDYGAFVELEPGVEGLVHISEISWNKKNNHPRLVLSTSQEVEVMVLQIDHDKRRIGLGLKQCMENPWEAFGRQYPPASVLSGIVKNITEFGLFVGLDGDVDGMVHLSDIDWQQSGPEALAKYSKNMEIKVKVLGIDPVKERISLGIKHLQGNDPFDSVAGMKKGDIVTCTIKSVQSKGVVAVIGDGLETFIKRSELSRDRSEKQPSRFAPGNKVDAKIISIDPGERMLSVSIKALEIQEEKEAVAQYGSSDSGASLGAILGVALDKAQKEQSAKEQSTKQNSPEKPAKAAEAGQKATKSPAQSPAQSAAQSPAQSPAQSLAQSAEDKDKSSTSSGDSDVDTDKPLAKASSPSAGKGTKKTTNEKAQPAPESKEKTD